MPKVVAVVAPHVRPMAVAKPVASPGALRILAALKGAKKMATGGLDDDAPPMYAAYMAAQHHMAKGGELEEEDENFAKGGMVNETDDPSDFLNLDDDFPDVEQPGGSNDSGSSDDTGDETGEGDDNSLVRKIFATIRAHHAGR